MNVEMTNEEYEIYKAWKKGSEELKEMENWERIKRLIQARLKEDYGIASKRDHTCPNGQITKYNTGDYTAVMRIVKIRLGKKDDKYKQPLLTDVEYKDAMKIIDAVLPPVENKTTAK